MKHYQTYKNLPLEATGCVVVIGNFDGVHLGHRALINIAKDMAVEKDKPLAVLTFEPHPRQLFRPDEPPCRITPKALKAEALERCGVDILYELGFDWNFASLSAQDFIDNILKDGINAAHIVVGNDFRFGQLRTGTPETIRTNNITVTTIEKLECTGGEDLSSSRIRQLLRHGKIAQANEMLGWSWEIRGAVFEGDKRGRALGYPTANMRLEDTIHPAYGIYAVFVNIEGEDIWRMGATNIGIRPMFTVPTAQVETCIFDFDGDLYGRTLRVRPVERLRGEAKFETLEALKAQMAMDCAQARAILSAIELHG